MHEILCNKTIENSMYIPPESLKPVIDSSATIRNSQITGNVCIKKDVHIVNAVIRADEGTPFYIGKGSNIQDFCILHGYIVRKGETEVQENLVIVDDKAFSIYIGEYVTIAHGALVHGPAFVGDNSFIGFKATIDASVVGRNTEIGAHAYIKRVTIPDNTCIAPNAVITSEEDIKKFIVQPSGINKTIVKVNIEMAKAYNSSFVLNEK